MKIYVITKGVYSDYHIIAVTADKELAEKLKEKYSSGRWEWEKAKIEEYCNAEAKLKNCYLALMHPDGDIEIIEWDMGEYEKTDAKITERIDGDIECSVWADNKEQAIKIASERRARYLYEKSEGMHDNNLKGE